MTRNGKGSIVGVGDGGRYLVPFILVTSLFSCGDLLIVS